MTTRRKFITLAGAALATPAIGRNAFAQAYPSRPIRAMVPFTAGSTLDVVGRIVMDPLSAVNGTIARIGRDG